MNLIKNLLFTLLLVLSLTLANAQTVTITAGSAWQDTYLYDRAGYRDANYATNPYLHARAWTNSGSPITIRSLMKMDLSAIPAGSTITSATLYLYGDPSWSGTVNSGSNAIYLERVTQPWNETQATWNNQPATTATGRIWHPASTSNIENIQVNVTNMVQYWVNNPSSNHGMMMKLASEVYYRSRRYASENYANSSYRPKLVITYQAPQIRTNYYNRMQHVFGAIDKNKVTTGLLKEFGVRLNDVETYNGSLSSLNFVDETQWTSLYNSLYSMRVGPSTSMTNPSSVFTHFDAEEAANPDVVLLAAQFYTYQEYKSNAYSNGDVLVSNDRIYDVSGRNPYITRTAFAVAPLEYHLEGNSFAFKLQSNLIYTNTTKTLSSVQVDFGNGQGYQTVSLNSIKNVTYSSGGEKELKVKFVYSGGPTLYSHSKLWVDYVPSTAQARFDGGNAQPPVMIQGAPFQGGVAVGDVTVETAGTDGVLDKPLIVVEGFDPDNETNYFNFIDGIGPGDINIPLGGGVTLNDAIETLDYDLVFVNFRNSTDFIQRNAFMVEEVINWVNANKSPVSEPNVVLGMSMGGLVARYALAHMEADAVAHDTDLFISHDVPHQGANLPLAFQAFVRHLAGESVGWPVFLSIFTIDVVDLQRIAPALGDALDLLNTPAAQQMLIYQLQGTGGNVTVNNNSPHAAFLTEIQAFGYPNIRNIAISNGSECGTPLDFGPYALLGDVNETIDLAGFSVNIAFTMLNGLSVNPIRTVTSFFSTNTDIKADFTMRALPDRQSREIYQGKIFIKKTVLGFINIEEQLIDQESLNSTTAMLPLDNSGGGIYDINRFADLPPQINIFEQRFNFIPTYSSLDIGEGDEPIISSDLARVYSPADPPAAPKNTPFANFFTNPIISQNHIQFTLENGNWLLDELSGNPGVHSCTYACDDTDISISGPSFLCTSNRTYTLQNQPPGTTVSWSVSPASLFAVDSGTGSSFTTRATNSSSSGSGTITATVTGDCGANFTRNVSVGNYRPTGTSSYNSNCSGNTYNTLNTSLSAACTANTPVYFSYNITDPNYSNLVFTPVSVPSGASWSVNGGNLNMTVYTPPSQGSRSATIAMSATGPCGPYSVNFTSTAVNYYSGVYYYSSYPNPASETLTIEQIEQTNNSEGTNEVGTFLKEGSSDTHYYRLYDFDNYEIVLEGSLSGKAEIDVSMLNKGMYILKIQIADDKEESHQVIIN